MSAPSPKVYLGLLPEPLRDELTAEFTKISQNYREYRWEASELNGGRFCEVVYSILYGYLDGGQYPNRATKPARFDQACKDLEKFDKTVYPDSARVTVPRVLVALYNIRNRRGVGHVGGEVDANHMDAKLVLNSAQWVMAELVRMFHDTTTVEATKVVEALVDRSLPLIWEVNGIRRILATGVSLADSTLLLAYSSLNGVSERDLASWLEQKSLGNYRRVLSRLHAARSIEYEGDSGRVTISPIGINQVEERILPSVG